MAGSENTSSRQGSGGEIPASAQAETCESQVGLLGVPAPPAKFKLEKPSAARTFAEMLLPDQV
jgi:hypothetical protein